MDRARVVDEQRERQHGNALEAPFRGEEANHATPSCQQDRWRRYKVRAAALSDAPEDVLESVLSWLNERDVATVMIASRRLKWISGSDRVWLPLYAHRFGETGSVPELSRQADAGETGGKIVSTSSGSAASFSGRREGIVRFAFRSRLTCPLAGDSVQVAWHGKFRLDAYMVFIGFSWWDAKVVAVELEDSSLPSTTREGTCSGGGGDRQDGEYPADNRSTHDSGGDGVAGENGGGGRSRVVGRRRAKRVLVHYRCWGSRWDEWIEPSRVRWARSVSSVDMCAEPGLRVDQQAELWCHGDASGGAWLDVRVHQVSQSLVGLSDRKLKSHVRWAARDRVRPKSNAPRTIAELAFLAYGDGEASAVEDAEGDKTDTGMRESCGRHGSSRSLLPTLMLQKSRQSKGLGQAGHRAVTSGKEGGCCTM